MTYIIICVYMEYLSLKYFLCQGTPYSKNIQATIECGFTLKHLRSMIKTYNQMHLTHTYSTQLNHLASLAKWLNVCLRTKWSRVP